MINVAIIEDEEREKDVLLSCLKRYCAAKKNGVFRKVVQKRGNVH